MFLSVQYVCALPLPSGTEGHEMSLFAVKMLVLFLVTVSSARLPVVKRNASPHLKWAKKAGADKMKVTMNKMMVFIFSCFCH